MREVDTAEDLYLCPSADAPHRADKVTHSVNGQDGSIIKRRDEKCAGHMRQVVLNIVEFGAKARAVDPKMLDQGRFGVANTRGIRKPIANQIEAGPPLERKQHLLVQVCTWVSRDTHVIQVVRADACLGQ